MVYTLVYTVYPWYIPKSGPCLLPRKPRSQHHPNSPHPRCSFVRQLATCHVVHGRGSEIAGWQPTAQLDFKYFPDLCCFSMFVPYSSMCLMVHGFSIFSLYLSPSVSAVIFWCFAAQVLLQHWEGQESLNADLRQMAGKSGRRLSAIWPWIMDDHGMKSGSDHLWLLEKKNWIWMT